MMKRVLLALISLVAFATCIPMAPLDEMSPAVTPALVETVNSKAYSWTAGHNWRFASMSIAEVKTLMGVLKGGEKAPPADHYRDIEVPAQFDARTAWPGCPSIAHIRDQSTCGSCWAFGAVEAMSDRLCVASNQTYTQELSAEDMLSCCILQCGSGCNGGFPTGAWHFFKKHGLTTEDKYPYVFPPCEHHINSTHYLPCGASKPTPKCDRAEETKPRFHGKSVYSVPAKNIQEEIFTNGPVEAAFTVYADFLTYKSGVYQHVTGAELGGHAIKVMGSHHYTQRLFPISHLYWRVQ